MSTAPTRTRTGQHSLFGWSLAALLREWSARVDAAADDLPQGTRGYQAPHGGGARRPARARRHSPPRSVSTARS